MQARLWEHLRLATRDQRSHPLERQERDLAGYAVQRFWCGTPDWFKAMNISIPGHAGIAAGSAANERR
jgi:hypothetical protein